MDISTKKRIRLLIIIIIGLLVIGFVFYRVQRKVSANLNSGLEINWPEIESIDY